MHLSISSRSLASACNVRNRSLHYGNRDKAARHKRDNDISRSRKQKLLSQVPLWKVCAGSGKQRWSDYRSQNCSLAPEQRVGRVLVLEWTFHFANVIIHALVRRELRIHFNWDYISIKTSSPLGGRRIEFRGERGGREKEVRPGRMVEGRRSGRRDEVGRGANN